MGKKVIIVGRTEAKLQETSNSLGHNTAYYKLDTGDIPSIPPFVKQVLDKHPEIDCLVNNAGVQRPLSFSDFDLAKADQEIDINIRGPMHLAAAFLPHFKSLSSGGTIINVSSVLGFVPFSVVNPVYNGTKAWVHFHTMNMRTQLAKEGANIRVVEIAPPSVGTDLHRDREDPDDNKKHKNPNALTIEEFMEEIKPQLEEGKEIVSAGMGLKITKQWYEQFGGTYEEMTK